MFPIIYLEEKTMIRNAMVAYIEQQEDCKVIYETGSIQAMQTYWKTPRKGLRSVFYQTTMDTKVYSN